ncbi:flagellin (plasmid) [Phyllobacterium sp. 628]|uniref:flagellin N-terminal helical domain-containing protein n=1 Tax=Phyllobacterium sp. 628 TaxID=2718938 RepID=UPI0016624251|nr:flagellin [Phyllobacterium sp. 628]QND50647.1 flagellin [Phyllobacterium sp. 628]
MSSILTNASAMTALQTLIATGKSLATTQDRIATGQRVATASDNAAYWSIATGMRSQNSALNAVKDGLGLGASIVDTAYTSLTKAIDLAQKIQAKYVAKETPGTDGAIIDADIAQFKAQIVEMAQGATFQGVNLLETGATAQNIVTGYTAGKGGATPKEGAVSTMTVSAYDLEAALASATTSGAVGTAIDAMKAAAASLGTAKARIDTQIDFTSLLTDAIDRGIGTLVDADMNKEAARLSSLQVQQQLGVQALQIANSSNQSIAQLFRN